MNKFEKNSAAKAEYLEKINEEWQNFHQIADIWYTFISRAIIHRGFFSYADFNFRNENSTPCKPCLDEQKLFAALGRNIQPAAEKCHQNFFSFIIQTRNPLLYAQIAANLAIGNNRILKERGLNILHNFPALKENEEDRFGQILLQYDLPEILFERLQKTKINHPCTWSIQNVNVSNSGHLDVGLYLLEHSAVDFEFWYHGALLIRDLSGLQPNYPAIDKLLSLTERCTPTPADKNVNRRCRHICMSMPLTSDNLLKLLVAVLEKFIIPEEAATTELIDAVTGLAVEHPLANQMSKAEKAAMALPVLQNLLCENTADALVRAYAEFLRRQSIPHEPIVSFLQLIYHAYGRKIRETTTENLLTSLRKRQYPGIPKLIRLITLHAKINSHAARLLVSGWPGPLSKTISNSPDTDKWLSLLPESIRENDRNAYLEILGSVIGELCNSLPATVWEQKLPQLTINLCDRGFTQFSKLPESLAASCRKRHALLEKYRELHRQISQEADSFISSVIS